jgi:aminoglycoside/choline kinase family phosphotransferase
VPSVVAESNSGREYLITDLGDVSLYDFMTYGWKNCNWTPDIVEMLKKVISRLPDFQWRGAEGLNRDMLPIPIMDVRSVMWDLNYFKYCFLLPSGTPYDEMRLQDDFDRFADLICSTECNTFMYRDFQSRNVMITDDEPWFIDYQGGRFGPYHYDVVSFLWQTRAAYPDELKEILIDTYIESANKYCEIDPIRFRWELVNFRFFRTLQVLGAYGFRGYFERKHAFINSIPGTIVNLRQLLPMIEPEFPYLCSVLSDMAQRVEQKHKDGDGEGLTVHIASFGYNRHGIPVDNSGNGGGFVFDCRAIHNPGRYAEYKELTGRDTPVIQFLENDGEILHFLDNVYGMVDNAVDTYNRRGFTRLMVSFGCTGGQHRSVYCANHLAQHIHDKFPDVRIVLSHYEQNIYETLDPER